MKQHWMQLQPWQKLALLGAAALFCILAVFGFVRLGQNRPSQGRTWIREQAAKDPAKLTPRLAEKRMAELKQAFAQGKVSWSALLPDYAMLGDSRARGFSDYGLFTEDRNLAVIGTDAQDIPNQIERLAALQPETLIFSYGVNDIQHDLGGSPEGFGQVYEDYIRQAAQAVPQARVFVTSILDVSQDVIDEYPQFGQLSAYNEQLKAMCEKNNWVFIDSSGLNEQARQSFESDGIHFTSDFYSLWAESIVNAVGDAA